jgi:hypothetical protein
MQVIPLDVAEVEVIVADKEPRIVVKGRWAWAADQLAIPPWGQILIIILLAEAGVLFTWLWTIHGDVRELQGTIRAMPLTISKDLLSQAKEDISAKKTNRAIQAANSAEILLARATANHVPAKPDDFRELVADLNILNASSTLPALTETATNTRIVLANYKSSLEPQPRMNGQQAPVEKSIVLSVEAATVNKSTLPGSFLVAPPGATFEFLETPFIRRLANGPSIQGVGFMNASQTLDGFHWDDVAFVSTLIRYEGGEVELRNARFINCTFQMSDSPRTAKVASYIVLDQPYLKIGPND